MTGDVLPLERKADTYRLFAGIFANEPTVEFLRLFRSDEGKPFRGECDVEPLDDLRDLSPEQQVESLAVEYADLFLLPGVTTSPRESLQRGEGKLWGDSTVRVNRIYKEFGFELDDSFKDTPDHLSAELSFLAELSVLEKKYADEGLLDAERGVLEVKKHFLKNHLRVWFPGFEKEIAKSAKLSYYRAFASLLGMFLDKEWEGLKAVRDIS